MRITHLAVLKRHSLIAAAAALSLAACGGDSDSSIRVSGVVAKGAPLVGATTNVTCKSGSGTATTASDGSYSVTVNNGTGPCLLTVVVAGVTLHSVTTGTGTELIANVSPLTEMLVSYLSKVPVSGGATFPTVEAWFANSATQSLLSSTAATNARITGDFLPVVRSLTNNAVTLADATFLGGTVTATPTNPVDAALDTLARTGVVTSNGAVTAATQTTLTNNASNDTPVPPTTTGSGG